MTSKELNKLISNLSSKKEPLSKYEGFAKIDNLELSVEELKAAVKVAEDIVLKMDKNERNEVYLFDQGLLKSKDNFLFTAQRYNKLTPGDQLKFDTQQKLFSAKLKNVEPLVSFILKLKEIL